MLHRCLGVSKGEEFREGMEDLKDFLYLHHLKPKIVNGMALNGTSFIALTEQYISAISEGGVPTITSAWSEVMQKECEDATVAALKVTISDFRRNTPREPVPRAQRTK